LARTCPTGRRRHGSLSVPDLVFAEVVNAFAGYVRASRLSREDALESLDVVLLLPSRVSAVRELAPAALQVAVSRGLSVYDACYAALAEAERAVLVTADRRLAAAVTQAELV
jgi:predicted nucleic acid-binding protein